MGELSEAQREYFSGHSAGSCPLFSAFLPAIAQDRGRDREAATPGFAEEMWAIAKGAPQTHILGPSVHLTRWYSWVDCWQFWAPAYHTRLVVMLYWAMGAGLLTRTANKKAFQLSAPPADTEAAAQKESMRVASSKLSMVHTKGANKLYVALLVLLNPDVHRKGAIIYEALADFRLFHGQQLAAC
eukprot:9151557-Lingulodinium_polyedra.AAC.1